MVDPRLRPFLMGLALVGGALVFLVTRSSGFGTALFAGAGTLALGIAASDMVSARPADRSQLLTWGMTFLGVGLLGLSLYVAVR
jgi:hypothetical protein